MTPADISIVIPTMNEESTITPSVRSCIDAGATEIIISDGGSIDATKQLASDAGATKIVQSLPGRGTQMNSGAVFATKEFVLFLHADARLDPDCLKQICNLDEVVWGAYRQHIDAQRLVYRWLETGNAMRVKWRRMPFGDQAVFVNRSVFKEQGGFEEVPLMEDLRFAKTMRKVSMPVLLTGPVTISARRWEKNGVVRQTLRNFKIQIAHALGASPETLARWYG